MGRSIGKGSNKVCLYSRLNPKFLVSGDKDAFYLPGTGRGSFHMGDLSPAFREIKNGQCILLTPAISQIPLIQIINMLKCHHLGWHSLLPFRGNQAV